MELKERCSQRTGATDFPHFGSVQKRVEITSDSGLSHLRYEDIAHWLFVRQIALIFYVMGNMN